MKVLETEACSTLPATIRPLFHQNKRGETSCTSSLPLHGGYKVAKLSNDKSGQHTALMTVY